MSTPPDQTQQTTNKPAELQVEQPQEPKKDATFRKLLIAFLVWFIIAILALAFHIPWVFRLMPVVIIGFVLYAAWATLKWLGLIKPK